MIDKIQAAERSLGVSFENKDFLRIALTHSSHAYEVGSVEFNERFEFLGDSVLGMVVTEFIFLRFPQMQEGALAKLRANLVCAETLSSAALRINLGDFVLLGKGVEQTGGRRNESILADCFEAVIGAIYLDQGYDKTKQFVLKVLEEKILEQAKRKELADSKTLLQELTAERWSVLPVYQTESQGGPPHKPVFSSEVSIKGKVFGRGVGSSKKRAEQIAAKEALKELSKLEI